MALATEREGGSSMNTQRWSSFFGIGSAVSVNPQTKPTVREMSAVVLPPIEKATVPAMRAALPTVFEDVDDVSEQTVLIDRVLLASMCDRLANNEEVES